MTQFKFAATLAVILCLTFTINGAPAAEPGKDGTHPASPASHQPGDPFERMAQATAQELKSNALFEGMDFEIFVAKPFVVLMTREPGADPVKTGERKARIEALARGIWHNWLKVRADWQLRSTRNDTLENPEPFVWTAFHSKAAYDQYMKKAKGDGKYTPGSQAFYSTVTKHVSFYEDPNRDPAIIIIHETFHQLMDRYSEVPSTKYRNYCFTEGAPEYFAGYRGSGESMVLGELTRPRRMKEIQEIRSHFDGGKTLCYPNAERRLQITPDDWIFFDVPMLLTLRDKMWVRAISRALVEQFSRSDYVERPLLQELRRRRRSEIPFRVLRVCVGVHLLAEQEPSGAIPPLCHGRLEHERRWRRRDLPRCLRHPPGAPAAGHPKPRRTRQPRRGEKPCARPSPVWTSASPFCARPRRFRTCTGNGRSGCAPPSRNCRTPRRTES